MTWDFHTERMITGNFISVHRLSKGVKKAMLSKIKNLLFPPKKPANFYQMLGAEAGIKELVHYFYHYMETDPKAIDCLNVHATIEGKVPDPVKTKLFEFLSGWLGGPNLFVEKYGHPRMRARHLHVKIGEKERDQWLYCMNMALKHHTKIKNKSKIELANSFAALALRIQNH